MNFTFSSNNCPQESRMERSPSSSSSPAAAADSRIGLKFGKKIYFEGVNPPKSGDGAPPPSPAKKGRGGAGQGGQPPLCQVEGCNVDLSDAKPYYSRHRVCGMHSKFPKVIVAGLEQRFCQQCSRFHQLPEFDQGKRSCRRRLAGHNERRRKPSPVALLSPRYGSLSPSAFDNHSKTVGLLMDFSGYSALHGRDSWPNIMSERGLGNQVNINGNQPQWQSSLQSSVHDLLQDSTRPSYSGSVASSEECYSGVSDSAGALSLLSNQPWGGSRSRSPSLGENNFLGTNEAVAVLPSASQGASINQFSFSSWPVFKGNQANDDTLHELRRPDLGLGQLPNPKYDGQLGLAQPSDEQFHDREQSRG